MPMEQSISIIAIHGNGGGGFRFDLAKPLFASNITFENLTLPGFDCVNNRQIDYSMKQYADWLADRIKDMQKPRILMGHGLGGVFVLEFLQHYAKMVDGVILHSIVGANLNKRIFPKFMRLPFVAFIVKNIIASRIVRPLMSRKFFQEKIDSSYENQFFEAFARCEVFERMFHLIDFPWFEGLSTVRVPAAFLWGEKDWILGANEISALQKLFPFSYKKIVPGWDHFPMIDQPASYSFEVSNLAYQVLEKSDVFK